MQSIDFFKNVKQSTLKIGDYDISVPMFYQSLTSMSVFLLASLEKVRSILPTNRVHPYCVTPWHCIITITAFEYKESDIGPYNQVSIGIPVFLDKPSPIFMGILRKPPKTPMIYLHTIAVTTEKVKAIGLEMANYPEFLADIHIENRDQWLSFKVEKDGKNILYFSGRKINLKPYPKESVYPITLRQNEVLRSAFYFNECQAGISKKQSDVSLEFGNHPIGNKLKELNVKKVLEYHYWPSQQAFLTTADKVI